MGAWVCVCLHPGICVCVCMKRTDISTMPSDPLYCMMYYFYEGYSLNMGMTLVQALHTDTVSCFYQLARMHSLNKHISAVVFHGSIYTRC